MGAKFQKLFLAISAIALLAALPACNLDSAREKPSPKNIAKSERANNNSNSFTLAQRELLAILQLQKNFELDCKAKKLGESEKQGRLSEIEKRWAAYMLENNSDTTSLILFGKFLKSNKNDADARLVFERADKLDPNIAVVKQQLATFEAERKNFASAYDYILKACELEPQTAVYHYQLGDLIYFGGTIIAQKRLISKEYLERQMLEAFKKAANLDKANDKFLTRYAQTFYDVSNPNWAEAMAAWREVLKNSKDPLARENALLNMAQVAIETSDFNSAEEFLKQVSLPDFNAQKAHIERRLKKLREKSAETNTNLTSQNITK